MIAFTIEIYLNIQIIIIQCLVYSLKYSWGWERWIKSVNVKIKGGGWNSFGDIWWGDMSKLPAIVLLLFLRHACSTVWNKHIAIAYFFTALLWTGELGAIRRDCRLKFAGEHLIALLECSRRAPGEQSEKLPWNNRGEQCTYSAESYSVIF